MVRVPHHDPEHGLRVMAVSASNRFTAQTALEPHLILATIISLTDCCRIRVDSPADEVGEFHS